MPLDNRNRKPTKNIPEVKELIQAEDDQVILDETQTDIDDIIADPKNELPVATKPEAKEDGASEEDGKQTVEPEKVQEPKEEIDYREKFRESSKESLNNFFKYKRLTETITEVSNMPDPTEEELKDYAKQNGADYDELDDFSKNILKKTLKNEMAMGSVTRVVQESNEIDKWVEKVDEFVNSSEVVNNFPAIAENSDAFRSYCLKASRRGMDLTDLSASFLFNLDKKDESKTRKSGGSLFNAQGNGRNAPDPVKEGLTAEDLAVLRVNNPKEYKRMITQGKAKLTL